jgi:hypothetical protein
MDHDEPRHDEKASLFTILLRSTCALVIAGLLYVLSIGPAARICWKKHGNFDAIDRFYSPVFFLADHSRIFEAAMGAYLSLWGH